MRDRIVEWARELQSIAQAGLYYGRDVYDRERYRRLREIALEMMGSRADVPAEKLRDLFCSDEGYQTPKVDTRGAIFKDGRILLVKENTGKWALPGGWCEYNLSPAENTVKEVREEAGLDVEVTRVIAVQDRDRHNIPPYACGIVKIFYECRALGGAFADNIETVESGWFSADDLPPLAVEKCSADQVRLCLEAHARADWQAQFD